MFPDQPPKRNRGRRIVVLAIVAVILLSIAHAYALLFTPATTFPVPYRMTITHGESVASLAHTLATDGSIASEQVFKVAVVALGGEKHLHEGEYYFDRKLSIFELAARFSGSGGAFLRTRVTFPEGFTVRDMGERLAQTLHTFTADEFVHASAKYEGYLFPDTYLFFPQATSTEVIDTLRTTFDEKTKELQTRAVANGMQWNDVVIMASIIEKEARGEDQAIVAGILWKRLHSSIALQVDATALYAKNDTRYDTYAHRGLPPTPIANPGIDALTAAVAPVATKYLYYLHDANGGIHYASTFAEHQANIKKYLK